MSTPLAFLESLPPSSLVPLNDFLAEASGSGALAPSQLVERWHVLERACDIFMQRGKDGEEIGGRYPVPSATALRDILPVLGREAGASAIGFELASAPRTFLKMIRVRQMAIARKQRVSKPASLK